MRPILFFLIVLLTSGIAFSQNTLSITVIEESGDPLIGATVSVMGSDIGGVTDISGKVSLSNIPDGIARIQLSFVGFEKLQIELQFPEDNQKDLTVQLEEYMERLEEIVIVTTRSSRSIDDIPTRIEVITSEELGEKAAMNSSNIGMLLSETTGVQMQQTSLSSGNMSIRIQGLDGRYTQILKDGFPLYGGFAGGLSIMQIPPLDLKQVELIKGSNSTLYGGGAIAGLVNLITIVPEAKPELSVMLNQTSALGTDGNLFYAQKYGKTGFSLYGSIHNQVAYDPDKDDFSNIPKSKTYNLNPKLSWYLNDRNELSVGLNYTADDREGGDMHVLKSGPDDIHTFFEHNISNRYSTMVNYKNHVDNHTISVKTSLSYFDRKLNMPDYIFSGDQRSSFSELIYHIHRKESSSWIFGANLYTESFKENSENSSRKQDYSFTTVGGFVQNTTVFNSFLTLESGFRGDFNYEYGSFLLPRVSVLLKPAKNLTGRIGGALGYKLPTIFTEDAERVYYREIAPIEVNSIDPETSVGLNFDINYKSVVFNDFTFAINQLFFYTQINNSLVLRENISEAGYYFENADGPVNSSGIETNVKLGYNNFSLYINYAFLNTRLNYDNINDQKPLTPRHNAGFVLYYEIEDNWSAGYELYFTGNQYDDMYDKKPEYWVMGVMVMKQFERISLFINFENFTNTIQSDYEPLVLPPYDDPVFPLIWAPADGFIFNGGLKVDIL